jgi:hypothetical protein
MEAAAAAEIASKPAKRVRSFEYGVHTFLTQHFFQLERSRISRGLRLLSASSSFICIFNSHSSVG